MTCLDAEILDCDVCGGDFFAATLGEPEGSTAECLGGDGHRDDEFHVFLRCPWCSSHHPVSEGGLA